VFANDYVNNYDEMNDIIFEYLNNSFIQRIRGIVLEHDSVLDRLLTDVLGFTWNYYICCNVFFDIDEEYSVGTQCLNTSFSPRTISKNISSILAEDYKTYTLDLNNNLFAYIINLEREADKADLKKTILKIERQIENIGGNCEITVGIGRIRNGINNLWKSYSDAMTAIEKRNRPSGYQVIDADNIPISFNVSYSFDEEDKIVNCMKARDTKSLKEVLQNIIRKNAEHNLSHKHMNILFSQLYNTGIRYAAEANFDIKKVASEGEQQLFNTDNSNTVKFDHKLIRLIVFLSRVMEIVAGEGKSSMSTLVSNIIDYIDSNYSNDIYSEKIASEMGLSSKYLSRVFKLKTGLTLTDYINLVRVKSQRNSCLIQGWVLMRFAGR
jgi:hypothetical protein